MPKGLIPEVFVQQSELVVWNDGMASKHQHDSCAICHELFSAAVPDICRVLTCSHVFHAKCVDLWFIKATFCPLCKSDLKSAIRNTSSQRSLGRSSPTSSQLSLGDRSHASSLRSGQILVGHSNSDPALLRILQENPHVLSVSHRASPPLTPDRQWHQGSTTSLAFSDRSLPGMGSSRSERSLGILSSSSSGALPAVQELSDEARFGDDSQRSHSSNPPSPLQASPGEIEEDHGVVGVHSDLWLERDCVGDMTANYMLHASSATASQSALETIDSKREAQLPPSAISGFATTGGSTRGRCRPVFISAQRNTSLINSRSNVGIRTTGRGGTAAAPCAGTPAMPGGTTVPADADTSAVGSLAQAQTKRQQCSSAPNPVQEPIEKFAPSSQQASSVTTATTPPNAPNTAPLSLPSSSSAPMSPPKAAGRPSTAPAAFGGTAAGNGPILAGIATPPSQGCVSSMPTNVPILAGIATPPSQGVATMHGNHGLGQHGYASSQHRGPFYAFTAANAGRCGTMSPTANAPSTGPAGSQLSSSQHHSATGLSTHQSHPSLQPW